MSDPIQTWINESDENQRLFNQEELIIHVSEAIWEILENKNISKAELADRLGKSRAYITQVLNGSRNMTLRTLADIATALELKIEVSFADASQNHSDWQQPNSDLHSPANRAAKRSRA